MAWPARTKLDSWLREQISIAENEVATIEQQLQEAKENLQYFRSHLEKLQMEEVPSPEELSIKTELNTEILEESSIKASKEESSSERRPKEMLRPEYLNKTLVEVAQEILENQNKVMGIDDIAKQAFAVKDEEEYERAKNSLAAELRRGAKDGKWKQAERGKFMSLNVDFTLDEDLPKGFDFAENYTLLGSHL